MEHTLQTLQENGILDLLYCNNILVVIFYTNAKELIVERRLHNCASQESSFAHVLKHYFLVQSA